MHDERLLVLWDLDGTLLDTNWTDKKAMAGAGRELIGHEFSIQGIDMAGRLDPHIWRDIAAANGVREPDSLENRYRTAYLACLQKRESEKSEIVALPGAPELVGRLEEQDRVTQGILSGNFPEIGICKLQSAGIAFRPFLLYAWGSDGATRQDLVPAALAQYSELAARPLDPERVIIIGDTIRDVECAKAHRCRCLAVATGEHSLDSLVRAGADWVCRDLSKTDEIIDWICR
jgi:phosphoglycolate phosphatase